jgi:serine/threonine-protein kinase
MTTEFQDRLIHTAVRKGYLDAGQVAHALRLLREAQAGGREAHLGSVLVEAGLLTEEQALDVRRTMAQEGLPPRLDDYDILSRVGRGSTGAVYCARQRSLDRQVAVKILSSHLAADPRYVERFLREARLAARFAHSNIIQVFDVGQWRDTHYIVMEYVPGRGLDRLIGAGEKLTEAQAVSVLLQVGRALRAAQERGIVHRDIKPANILLTPSGVAKLADLGLALAPGEQAEQSCGTPYYASPEQIRNEAVDARSDIYSLGCALYHALTGRPPFDGRTVVETLRMHAETAAPDVRALRPDLSVRFGRLLSRMMAKRPAERFESPAALIEAVEKLSAAAARDRGLTVLWVLAFSMGAMVMIMLLLIVLAIAMKTGRHTL